MQTSVTWQNTMAEKQECTWWHVAPSSLTILLLMVLLQKHTLQTFDKDVSHQMVSLTEQQSLTNKQLTLDQVLNLSL